MGATFVASNDTGTGVSGSDGSSLRTHRVAAREPASRPAALIVTCTFVVAFTAVAPDAMSTLSQGTSSTVAHEGEVDSATDQCRFAGPRLWIANGRTTLAPAGALPV